MGNAVPRGGVLPVNWKLTASRWKRCWKECRVAKADKKIAKVSRKPENRVQRYFRETTGELKKVSWPTRQEATSLTVVVLVVILIMSSFLGILDFIYSRFFVLILGS
jgi:preprotein translocase subunit SecE